MINNNGAQNIFAGHVVRGERLNSWFPLDNRYAATKIVPDWPMAELFT